MLQGDMVMEVTAMNNAMEYQLSISMTSLNTVKIELNYYFL